MAIMDRKHFLFSNKAMFVLCGLLMMYLGGFLVLDAYRTNRIISEQNIVRVTIDKIGKSRKTSTLFFHFNGRSHSLRLANSAIKEDNVRDVIELYHSPEYPALFIYKKSRSPFSYVFGTIMTLAGLYVLIRGIRHSNTQLVIRP